MVRGARVAAAAAAAAVMLLLLLLHNEMMAVNERELRKCLSYELFVCVYEMAHGAPVF